MVVGLHVANHLARRGYEAVTVAAQGTVNHHVAEYVVWPLFVTTGVVFVLFYVSVSYTLGDVVATLAMIEQPQTTVVAHSKRVSVEGSDVGASSDKHEKEPLMDEETIVIKQTPLTSCIRKTIRHLTSVEGFTARWGGIGSAIVYHISHGFIFNLVDALFGYTSLLNPISFIVPSVMLSTLRMTWTHSIISKSPGTKWWFVRVSNKAAFKTLLLPSAVYATAQFLTYSLSILAVNVISKEDISYPVGGLIMLVLNILIVLPASVTLTRIEASLLPEDEDTIVPFDRTLNGAKVAAVALDDGTPVAPASGKSLFIEAWRSFDMSSRRRLVGFYAKMAVIQFSIILFSILVLMGEVGLVGSGLK